MSQQFGNNVARYAGRGLCIESPLLQCHFKYLLQVVIRENIKIHG